MLKGVKRFFDRLEAQAKAPAHDVDQLHLAAAALLVHAACIDTQFDAVERDAILAMAQDRLNLAPEDAAALVEAAENAVENAVQILHFTQKVKDGFAYDERVQLIEMLWEVVMADGRVDAFESQLMRRLAGLLYVDDRDAGAARQRAARRLGKRDSAGRD